MGMRRLLSTPASKRQPPLHLRSIDECSLRFCHQVRGGRFPDDLQVYLHYSVATAAGQVLQSTRIEEGGAGLPLAFVIGKGRRVPRGWELAILGVLSASPLRLHFNDSHWAGHFLSGGKQNLCCLKFGPSSQACGGGGAARK